MLRGGLDNCSARFGPARKQIQAAELRPTISRRRFEERLSGRLASSLWTRGCRSGTGEVEPIDPNFAGPARGHAQPGEPSAVGLDVEVAVYRGSGITAAVSRLLRLERTGVAARELYPGSWSEWSSRGLAVERG